MMAIFSSSVQNPEHSRNVVRFLTATVLLAFLSCPSAWAHPIGEIRQMTTIRREGDRLLIEYRTVVGPTTAAFMRPDRDGNGRIAPEELEAFLKEFETTVLPQFALTLDGRKTALKRIGGTFLPRPEGRDYGVIVTCIFQAEIPDAGGKAQAASISDRNWGMNMLWSMSYCFRVRDGFDGVTVSKDERTANFRIPASAKKEEGAKVAAESDDSSIEERGILGQMYIVPSAAGVVIQVFAPVQKDVAAKIKAMGKALSIMPEKAETLAREAEGDFRDRLSVLLDGKRSNLTCGPAALHPAPNGGSAFFSAVYTIRYAKPPKTITTNLALASPPVMPEWLVCPSDGFASALTAAQTTERYTATLVLTPQ
jgi:hypothetical protein